MSSFTFLQPHLLTTEQLRDHLKTRFPSRNLSTLSRDELLKLFSIYAIPKARRTTSNADVEMASVNANVTRANEHKRSRAQMISAPTVETVTNACKKIRLINTAASQKRPCQPSPMESDTDMRTPDPIQTKRKKITWP